jgi:hypothetical protein
MRGRLLILFVISLFVLQNVVGIGQGTGDWGINRDLIEGEQLSFTVTGATNANIRWSMVLLGSSLPIPQGKFSPSSIGVSSVTFTVPPVNSYSSGYYQFKVRATDISDNTFAESNEYMTIRDYVQDYQFGHECLVIDTGYCSDINSQGDISSQDVISSVTRVSSWELYSFGPTTVSSDLTVGDDLTVFGGATIENPFKVIDTIIYPNPTYNDGAASKPICCNPATVDFWCQEEKDRNGGVSGNIIDTSVSCFRYSGSAWFEDTGNTCQANCYETVLQATDTTVKVNDQDVCLKDGTNCDFFIDPDLEYVTSKGDTTTHSLTSAGGFIPAKYAVVLIEEGNSIPAPICSCDTDPDGVQCSDPFLSWTEAGDFCYDVYGFNGADMLYYYSKFQRTKYDVDAYIAGDLDVADDSFLKNLWLTSIFASTINSGSASINNLYLPQGSNNGIRFSGANSEKQIYVDGDDVVINLG